MDDLVSITTTANDAEWLASFVRDLVEARLVACGNIIPAVRSIYSWQGAVEEEAESVAVLHTRAARVPECWTEFVKSHPYDEPQFLVYAISDASPGYASWVREATTTHIGDPSDHPARPGD